MATVLLSESWTGSNGAAWPAAWQAQSDQGGTATIQNSAGQLVGPASSTAAARQQTVASLASGDFDIVVSVTVPSGQPDFSIGIAWRADGTSDAAAPPGSRMFPLNGQSLRLDTNGDLFLYRQNSGGLTVITSSATNVGSLLGTGTRKLRISQVGTALRVRVWAASAAEPAVWTLNTTDAGAWTSSGKLSIAVAAGFGGAGTTTQTATFDDLTVTNNPASPSPSPSASASASPSATATPTPVAGTRRSWTSLSAADQQAVINGLLRAKASGAYDNLTRMHQQAMVGASTDWHQRPIFAPVHRWFLTQLESAAGVTMPYWDWTSQPFPAGLGGDGNPAQSYRVTSGPFAGWSSVVYNSTTGTFSTRAGVIRRFGNATPSLPTASQVASVLNQTVYDSAPWSSSATQGFRNWMEGFTGNPGPATHNRVHEWVGGDMRVGTSPNDPVFWFHHANVDRIWAGWQTRHGISNYAAPAGQGANDPMPFTGGVTPAQMFAIPSYDQLP